MFVVAINSLHQQLCCSEIYYYAITWSVLGGVTKILPITISIRMLMHGCGEATDINVLNCEPLYYVCGKVACDT